MNPYGLLSHLGLSLRAFLQNPVTSGRLRTRKPSKPCHIWVRDPRASFKTLSHLGLRTWERPSKPCHIWGSAAARCLQNPVTSGSLRFHQFLQNPVTSGRKDGLDPSKPCHIWVFGYQERPSKPCHIWASTPIFCLQNPVTSGKCLQTGPSKPCHIWAYHPSCHLQNPVTSGVPKFSAPSKPCHIWEITTNHLWCIEKSE